VILRRRQRPDVAMQFNYGRSVLDGLGDLEGETNDDYLQEAGHPCGRRPEPSELQPELSFRSRSDDTSCMPTRVDGRRGLAVAAGVFYATVASLSRPLTDAAAIAVAVPAALVLARACRRRCPAPACAVSAPVRRTAVAWPGGRSGSGLPRSAR